MHSCMRAYATVQTLLCHGSYCELILSLARASCRLSFAARSCRPSTNPVARRCSLKKSVQIHASSRRGYCCGVAQPSFDHPLCCRPGPRPVCLWDTLTLGHGKQSSSRIMFSQWFMRAFLQACVEVPHLTVVVVHTFKSE